jgi:hypothetical protein
VGFDDPVDEVEALEKAGHPRAPGLGDVQKNRAVF